MSNLHLNEGELNLVVLGEDLPPDAAAHFADCLVCRRRRDAFLALAEAARGADPDEATRVRLREGALAAWGAPRRRHPVRWLVASAAMIVVSLLPLVLHRTAAPPAVNADTVLLEVNQVLERDPLSALASEELVDTVVPVSYQSGERSLS